MTKPYDHDYDMACTELERGVTLVRDQMEHFRIVEVCTKDQAKVLIALSKALMPMIEARRLAEMRIKQKKEEQAK